MENIKEYVARKKISLGEYFSNLGKKVNLTIVQVNDDEASNAYIRGKLKDCAEIGIDANLIKLDLSTTEDELLKLVDELNNNPKVTGFIVQMPLPNGINEEKIKRAISPEKDIDGFNPLSTFLSATPKGIVEFLKDNKFEFRGKNAVILGRSNIVGKPMHKALLDLDMNVINLHSKTTDEDKKFYIEHADLIVVAIGKKHFLTNNYNFKNNCVVMDVGINRVDGKLYGDCEPELKVLYQSPVPGGVGLLTRLALLINFMEATNNGI